MEPGSKQFSSKIFNWNSFGFGSAYCRWEMCSLHFGIPVNKTTKLCLEVQQLLHQRF